jgi:(p)ppGpp synthase/HD superfamily hydrolase
VGIATIQLNVMDNVYKAEIYASKKHREVNQDFDGHPYRYHLQGVVEVAKEFADILPSQDVNEVLVGCWVHDVLEDTHETYNDIKKVLGETAAEYSYALTNEKGRNRAERANAKYYEGIKNYRHATFVKLCDRMFNTKYSKEQGSSMFNKYKSEYPGFRSKLYDGRYQELWDALDKIYNN